MEQIIEKIDDTTANIITPQPNLVETVSIDELKNRIANYEESIISNQNQITFLQNEKAKDEALLDKLLEAGLKLITE